MTLRKIVFLAVALAMTGSASQAEEFVAMGIGNDTCGQFIESRQKSSYINWAQGYVSGLNTLDDSGRREVSFDSGTATAWLRNYCGTNPLDAFLTAVQELRNELLRRAKGR